MSLWSLQIDRQTTMSSWALGYSWRVSKIYPFRSCLLNLQQLLQCEEVYVLFKSCSAWVRGISVTPRQIIQEVSLQTRESGRAGQGTLPTLLSCSMCMSTHVWLYTSPIRCACASKKLKIGKTNRKICGFWNFYLELLGPH